MKEGRKDGRTEGRLYLVKVRLVVPISLEFCHQRLPNERKQYEGRKERRTEGRKDGRTDGRKVLLGKWRHDHPYADAKESSTLQKGRKERYMCIYIYIYIYIYRME